MSKIGTTNVTIINNKSGATKRKALILFFLSVFLRLTLRGSPSVVNIWSVVEIISSNKKGELNSPFF